MCETPTTTQVVRPKTKDGRPEQMTSEKRMARQYQQEQRTNTCFRFSASSCPSQDVFFEEIVGKVTAAAGNEDDDEKEDDQAGGKNPDSPPPPPIPTATPPGMVSPRPLAQNHPEEVRPPMPVLSGR